MSLPLRERGLKCFSLRCISLVVSVAPFTGAWIEIRMTAIDREYIQRSLPLRERGLKWIDDSSRQLTVCRRSLYGSVD